MRPTGIRIDHRFLEAQHEAAQERGGRKESKPSVKVRLKDVLNEPHKRLEPDNNREQEKDQEGEKDHVIDRGQSCSL